MTWKISQWQGEPCFLYKFNVQSFWVGIPTSLTRKKASSRFVLSYAWLGWNGSLQHLQKMGSLNKQFECLEKIYIRRYFKPEGFGIIKKVSLHHFSDASEEVYGQSIYLRLINMSGKIHYCLLMGKSRVTPKKYVTLPCLELVAAVLSVKLAALIRGELEIERKNEPFWTDSKLVLGYIIIIPKSSRYFLLTEYSRYMRSPMSVNEDMFHRKWTQQMMLHVD